MTRHYEIGKCRVEIKREPGMSPTIEVDPPGMVSTAVICDYCEVRTVVPDGGFVGPGRTCPDGWRIVEILEEGKFFDVRLPKHPNTRDMCPECVREEGLRDV
jgi:hypothetical protein